MSDKLRFGDEHPLAAAIREAIGAGPYDDIGVVSPQFDREDGKTFSFRPLKDAAFFDRLRHAPKEILIGIGMRQWDEESGLLLFPCEWYDSIPEGYEITDINGCVEPFEHGVTDDDRRGGMLPYGFVPIPQEGGQ